MRVSAKHLSSYLQWEENTGQSNYWGITKLWLRDEHGDHYYKLGLLYFAKILGDVQFKGGEYFEH